MIEKVCDTIKHYDMIPKDAYVIAGVSGGADSVSLLDILNELKERSSFKLAVIHVEHGIRGDESMSDAAFVASLCEKMCIDCTIVHVNATGYAAEHGLGLEEAARILRYGEYEKAVNDAAKDGISHDKIRVALAHHADDNAETVIFQMVRGSGIRGLSGINAVRPFAEGSAIIRPLIDCTRSEIESYLESKSQPYKVDSTNTDIAYSRNRIRHMVMPQLMEINARAIEHIGRSAAYMKEIADYVDIESERVMNEVYRENDRGLLLYNSLIQEHIVIQRNIVHRALADICGSSKDIGDAHIDSVVSLFALQVGRLVELPYGIRAVKVYDGVELRRKNDESAGRMALGGKPGTAGDKRMVPGDKCISPVQKGGAPAGGSAEDRRMEPFELTDEMLSRIERGETVTAAFPSGKICFRMVLMAQAIDKPPKKKYTKWFDYDIIKCRLVVRTRASGDYFILDESGHRRKLKEYFITEKVPSYERDGVMLLAQQSRIAWIIGYRMSEDVKVTDATDRILEVTYMPQHAADSGSARQ